MFQRNAHPMRRGGSCAWLLVCLFAAAAVAQRAAPPEQPENEPQAQQTTPEAPDTSEQRDAAGMQGMGGMQMSCCPPSAMSKMADKPAGMAMMMVCGFLVAALLASIIAVLVALTIFLIRRSRPPVITA